ncbi:MAG TPA: flagellar FliJ family protein [Chromobacteriaceae bacterium]|nr:flagellar FliJ family protein [Chromobacteriaceae bacterium]
MSLEHTIQSLSQLTALRQGEVDRLSADIARQEATRQRYQKNLARMAGLCEGSGASGSLPPALSLNCASYKLTVMSMMASHQMDLALHEADMAVTREHLMQATRQSEVMAQMLEQKREILRREQSGREQKRQDELAAQVWLRRTVP